MQPDTGHPVYLVPVDCQPVLLNNALGVTRVGIPGPPEHILNLVVAPIIAITCTEQIYLILSQMNKAQATRQLQAGALLKYGRFVQDRNQVSSHAWQLMPLHAHDMMLIGACCYWAK